MSENRLAAMAAAVVLMGFVPAVIAEENIEITPADPAPALNAFERSPAETPAPQIPAPSEQNLAQPAENLLSEFKVYPSF